MSSATYDATNQIDTWDSTSFTYDANGNLTDDGTNTYTWNTRNQLAGISGGASASFAYDGVGRRRGKTLSSTATKFLYDRLNPVQELNGGGTPTANMLLGLNIDEVFRRTDSGGARDLLADVLGSTLSLADGSGAVQTDYTYEPFGATTTSGSGSTNAWQFTGREDDDGTGLYYFRARFYSPTLQRFLSEDQVGFLGGDLDLYGYVNNSPQFPDPSGHFGPAAAMALGCILGAGASAASDVMGGRKINWPLAAAGCLAGGLGGFFGAGGAAAAGASGATAAAASAGAEAAAAGSRAPGFSGPQVDGLRQLFGKGLEGATKLVERLENGEDVPLPEGVTPDTLQKYRDVAEKAIQ